MFSNNVTRGKMDLDLWEGRNRRKERAWPGRWSPGPISEEEPGFEVEEIMGTLAELGSPWGGGGEENKQAAQTRAFHTPGNTFLCATCCYGKGEICLPCSFAFASKIKGAQKETSISDFRHLGCRELTHVAISVKYPAHGQNYTPIINIIIDQYTYT